MILLSVDSSFILKMFECEVWMRFRLVSVEPLRRWHVYRLVVMF